MIDESILRKQLATTRTIFDWMQSFSDEIKLQVEAINKEITNVMYIDMTNMERFKKSVESFKMQHPEANIQATGFIFSTKEPEENENYSYPEIIKDKNKEEIMKATKTAKKSKPKTTKKSKK